MPSPAATRTLSNIAALATVHAYWRKPFMSLEELSVDGYSTFSDFHQATGSQFGQVFVLVRLGTVLDVLQAAGVDIIGLDYVTFRHGLGSF